MNESDIRALVSAYLDEELSPEDRVRVEEALAGDAALREELEAMRSVDALFRSSAPSVSAPEDFASQVRMAVQAGKGESAPAGRVVSIASWRRLVPLAAAAGLLAAVGLAWQFSAEGPARYKVADAPQMDRQALPETGAMVMRGEEESAAAVMDEAGEGAAFAPSASRMAAPMAESMPDALAETFTDTGADAGADVDGFPGVGERPQVLSLQALAAEPPIVQQVGEMSFHLVEGRWVQEGYQGESVTAVSREDARWLTLTEDDPNRILRGLPQPIVLRMQEEWVEVEAMPDSITAGPLE